MIGTVALATCAEVPVESNEAPLERALERAGVAYAWQVWDDEAVDWAAYAGVLIRTVWDYSEKVGSFRAWASRVAEQTNVWNPAPVVVWNSHKRYLVELADRAIASVPTALVPVGTSPVLDVVLGGANDGIVVKPAESVGAIGLSRWSADPAGRAGAVDAIAALHADGQDVLVQPLLGAVRDQGEISVVVIDGAVSHAVRKVPAVGDIRSQPEWGASLTAVEPTTLHRDLVDASLAAAAELTGVPQEELVYARVDCVEHDGRPCLMELELIEPDLYLGFDDAAADRVVAAMRRRLDP